MKNISKQRDPSKDIKEISEAANKQIKQLLKEISISTSNEEEELLRRYRVESQEITKKMDAWLKDENKESKKNDFPHLTAWFFGACSGEWMARSLYRGALPGTGGFLLIANDKRILIDPGAGTFRAMTSDNVKEFPKFVNLIISTHAHWDCTRDLQLLILAACPTSDDIPTTSQQITNTPKLLAHKSVLWGLKKPEEHNLIQLITGSKNVDYTQNADLQKRLESFTNIHPAAMSIYDLEKRLQGRYEELDIGKTYHVTKDDHSIEITARKSYHKVTYEEIGLPSLDIIVHGPNNRSIRCVYLADTEYAPELAEQYNKYGKINLLVINVKTLDVLPQNTKTGKVLDSFTKKHLGWKGLVHLTQDFKKLDILDSNAHIVLRAWGIETVTQIGEDGRLEAFPEKLRTIKKVYERILTSEHPKGKKWGNLKAIIPDITRIDISRINERELLDINYEHIRQPYSSDVGEVRHFGHVYYRSKEMVEVVHQAKMASRAPGNNRPPQNVLILGETGTGKDELAVAMHEWAAKFNNKPGELFIASAPTLPTELAWDTWVGHVKGAFTGAEKETDGIYKKAGEGTIVIQEIGDMPLRHQAQLLQVLQDRKYSKLGRPEKSETLCAQIIATTDKDLGNAVRTGIFRQQLIQRFDVIIQIPPLRKRRDDIPAIIQGALLRENLQQLIHPDLDVVELLMNSKYLWPGNVRQLLRVLRHAADTAEWSLKSVGTIADREEKWSLECSDIFYEEKQDKLINELDDIDKKIVDCIGSKAMGQKEIYENLLITRKDLNKNTFKSRLYKLVDRGILRKGQARGKNTKYTLN